MEILFTISIKITTMVHITRQIIIAHAGMFAVRIYRKMTRIISPVIVGTMKYRSTIAFSPSSFIKNKGYREIF